MQFKMNDQDYDVMFQYEDVPSDYSGTTVKQTRCFISWIDPSKQGRERFVRVANGVATQNPVDPFVKAVGRRRALDRALHTTGAIKIGIDHSNRRRKVWDRYFDTHKDLVKK